MGISIRVTARPLAVMKSIVPVLLGRLGSAARGNQRRHDEDAECNSDQKPHHKLPHGAGGSADRNEHARQPLYVRRSHVGEHETDIELRRAATASSVRQTTVAQQPEGGWGGISTS